MGVYSNLAVQKVNEQNMLENFKFSDLLEFAMDIQRSDQAMFDAMLEMDFHEAYEAKGIISLTEGEKLEAVKAAAKQIGDKILKALNKFLEMVTTFLAKMSNVFATLTKRNKHLIDRYGNFEGEKEKVILEYIEGKDIEITAITDYKKAGSALGGKLGDITYLKTKITSMDMDKDSVKDEFKGIIKTISDDINESFEKIKVKDYINKPNILKDLYEAVAHPETEFDKLKGRIEVIKGKIKRDIDEYKTAATDTNKADEDRARDNEIVTNLNVIMAGIAKILSATKNYCARKAACDRSVYAKLGSLYDKATKAAEANNKDAKEEKSEAQEAPATEEKKEEATGESAINYDFVAIDVMNEAYIDELFA